MEADTNTIRGGNYGGILILFSESGSDVVVASALNSFMVQNMVHRVNPDPGADPTNPGALDFGLMGSMEKIDGRSGLTLQTVISHVLYLF